MEKIIDRPPDWLWNDLKWIERRIREQDNYISDLIIRYIPDFGLMKARYWELKDHAEFIRSKFEKRRKELNQSISSFG